MRDDPRVHDERGGPRPGLLLAAIEAVKDCVLIADPDGSIRLANAAFARLVGSLAGESGFPSTVDRMFLGEDRPPIIAELARSPSREWSGEATIGGAGGVELAARVSIGPALDEAGGLLGFTVVLADLTESRRVDARLRMFEQAVVHCLEPVVITEAEPIEEPGPRIVYVNGAFTEVTGYTLEEVLGKTPRILQGPGTQRDELDRVRKALKRWKPVKAEFRNYRKDGTEFWVEVAIFPVADDKGWFTHWVSVQRDITEKKRGEEELRAAKEVAERANVSKSSFLANMSHEIRTPLTAILGYTEILMDPRTEAGEHDESLRSIRRNGRHLLGVVGNILDLSKIEAGKVVMDAIPYAPWRLALEVDSSHSVLAAEKQVTLKTSAVGPLPAECLLDPTWVRQILFNLVSNAIKFTEPGGLVSLEVGARLVPGTDRGVELEFAVEDEGIGMNEGVMRRLFQAFEQGDNSATRRHGGTGLGLNISRKLIELMGGSIKATSSPGVGSRFEVVLPCQLVDPSKPWARPDSGIIGSLPATARESAPRPAAPRLSGRILIVDDNADNRLILHHHVRPTGLAIEMAENGRQAIDRALSRPYEIMLLDMQMPEVDGYTAARELRKNGYDRPIIALTAHAMPEDRLRCLRAGCNDYLSKPVTVADLQAMLARHLVDEDTDHEASPLRSTLPGDDLMLAELARDYANRLGDQLAELRAAFDADDRDKLGWIAHMVKGSAGMYGFDLLGDSASRIEDEIRQPHDRDLLARIVDEFASLVARIRRGIDP